MKKFLVVGLAGAILAGCSGEAPKQENALGNVICLQGVQYYSYQRSQGNAGFGYLAPVFDKETKQIKICN